MTNRQNLPVLPLRGTVIFPGLAAPIAAGRPGTLRAIEAALKGDRLVFAVAQRDNAEEPQPDILYSMGVIARIGQVNRGLGGVQLLLQGEERATALQYTQGDGFLSAVVMKTQDMLPLDDRDPEALRYNSATTDGSSRSNMARLNVQWNKRIDDKSRVETRLGIGRMTMFSSSHREEDNVGASATTFFRTQDDTTRSRDTNWSFNTKLTHQMDNEHNLVAGVEGEGTKRHQNRACLQSYTEGNIPEALMSVPSTWNVTRSSRRTRVHHDMFIWAMTLPSSWNVA